MAGIGFFAPLPLALMMPFMAGQSMMMGDAFGKAFQYGKRKISAMSNEEFNSMDPNDLAQSINTDYTAIISTMEEAMVQSREFQKLILIEMGEIIKDIPDVLKDFFFGGASGDTTLPTNPSPTYDWSISIANFLSATGFQIASDNYNTLKSALENFFAPLITFTDQALTDAQKLVDDFLKNLLPPTEDPDEPIQPDPEDPNPNEPSDPLVIGDPVLFQEFIDSIIGDESEFSTGGHRHRNYKGVFMHYEIPNKWFWNVNTKKITRYDWSANGWNFLGTAFTDNTADQFFTKANTHKLAIGASLVIQFGSTLGWTLYFIKTTHTEF